MAVKPIPEGYHTATPYLIIKCAGAAIEFYKKALGAVELCRMPGPGDQVMHAEIKVGDSIIMLADEFPDMGYRGPESRGGTTVSIVLYVEDVDKSYAKAVAAGAAATRPVKDEFWGDRMGTVTDPFGHVWTISTHTEDVSVEEMQRRMAAMQAAA